MTTIPQRRTRCSTARSGPSATSTSCATARWLAWKSSAGSNSDMRALIKTRPGVGNLELLEIVPPSPGPGEALVRVGQSGMCGTDLLVYDDRYRGRKRPMPFPLILGHEAAGDVVELGPGTSW